MIRSPRTDSIIKNPTTKKEYRIIGPADEIYKGQFKSPSNCKKGSRLWVICGFELDDTPILKDTQSIRSFELVESGKHKVTKCQNDG